VQFPTDPPPRCACASHAPHPPVRRRPAASRWLPLKGPSCFMPERAASSNMTRLAGALQSLQDEGRGKSGVLGLAGQLLHAGRQDRAAQVCMCVQGLVCKVFCMACDCVHLSTLCRLLKSVGRCCKAWALPAAMSTGCSCLRGSVDRELFVHF
jgi:hypothetical protein